MVKNPSANAGNARDVGLMPGSGRALGGGHGNPLQYSCPENSMDKVAWWAIVLDDTGSDMTESLSMHTHKKRIQN